MFIFFSSMKLAGIHLIWKCQQRDRTAFQIISGYFCDLPNGMMTRVPEKNSGHFALFPLVFRDNFLITMMTFNLFVTSKIKLSKS